MSSYTFIDTYEIEGLENKILELEINNTSYYINHVRVLYVIYNNEFYYCTKLRGYTQIMHLTLHKTNTDILQLKCDMHYYTFTKVDSICKELADKYESYCGNNGYILK